MSQSVIFLTPSSATTLLPGQDKVPTPIPISAPDGVVVFRVLRSSEVLSGTVRKPQDTDSTPVAGGFLS